MENRSEAKDFVRTREQVLRVEGVTCAGCVRRVENALLAVAGVTSARLDLATRKAVVAADAAVGAQVLTEALARAGYRAHAAGDALAASRERRRSLWRVALAGFAMMQIMMFAYPAYVADEGTLSWDAQRLFALASLALTLPVLLVSARPILVAAWRGVLARSPGMDLPVALGILVSFAASVHNTFVGGDVYYDSIAMFVFFVLVARHLESGALAHAARASESAASLLPRRARRIVEGGTEEIECSSLVRGDRVAVRAGEAAPADLVVLAGESECDEALVTGESIPVQKRPGDRVLAGSVNLSAPLEARVERCGPEQTLEQIRQLVERAAADKPRWTLVADRVARHFAVAVVGLALAGALAWLWIDPGRALWVAVATLVVSCPCALALATPAAVAASLNRLARKGVLVTRARALETLAGVTHVVFDKTGTLTTGRLRLREVCVFRGDRDASVRIAAALESAMAHPIAHAFAAEAPAGVARASNLRAVTGAGVEGFVDGRRYRVGSTQFCAELCGEAPPESEASGPGAFLADESGFLAGFGFVDRVRREAASVVSKLRAAGCTVVLLSGDREAVVKPVAQALGVDEWIAGAAPEEKARRIAAWVASGARVAMVGDGVNDAPGLAGAHVAITPGNGTALAQSQADFVLLNPSLEAIVEALETSRRTRAVVKQSLAWAALYNALALPLALAGVLTPWLASLGMSLSSLLVVMNALRLARPPSAPRSVAPRLIPVS